MAIRPLDIDVSIYRDRVQLRHRARATLIDQPAKFAFSTEEEVIAQPRFLEHTLALALAKIMAEGGFSLRHPIAHVVAFEGELDESGRKTIENVLRDIGIADIIFEVDD